MRRRRVLQSAATLIPVLGGCLSPSSEKTLAVERIEPLTGSFYIDLTDLGQSLSYRETGPVWNAADAPSDVRSVVREAATQTGRYLTDGPPKGLIDRLRSNEFVRLNDRVYSIYVGKMEPLPVSLEATFADATLGDTTARIELTLRNESERELEVGSGAPPPFGVLYFHPPGDINQLSSDGSQFHILWTDAYAASEFVATDGHSIKQVDSIRLDTPVGPKESLGRSFAVEQTGLDPGRYIIESDLTIEDSVDSLGRFPYRIVFTVTA